MTREPMVSVILRTKDRPLLLRRALGSVLGQTLDSWRILLVDDGGAPDAVSSVLAELGLSDDARIQIVRGDGPLGRPGALNAGLEAVVTAFWTIHDDDDTWAPSFLETCVEWLGRNPGDGAVATRTAVISERLMDDGALVEVDRELFSAITTQVTLDDLMVSNKFTTNSMLWRASLLPEVGLYSTDLDVLEDWEFILRVASRYPIGFIDGEPLAFYHQRPEGSGAEANSVFAESDRHAAYVSRIRDRFLRNQPSAIAATLTIAGLLDEGQRRDAAARAEQARVADQWGHAHHDHLASVVELIRATSADIQIEIGRLRGELISLRAQMDKQHTQVQRRQERLQTAVRAIRSAVEPSERPALGRRVRAKAGKAARRAGLRGGKPKQG